MEKICLDSKFSTTRELVKCDVGCQSQSIVSRLEGGLRKAGYGKSTSASNPLVSIITVTFNGAGFLEQTIKSVLELAYSNIEYIIIDGGSKDGTVDLLRKYNEQLDYWVSEPDKGIYDAMNKGWAMANERAFILYLGAGDTIKSLPANMNTYKSDEIIYGNVMLSPTKVFLSKADSRLCFRNTLHHQALLINKSIHPEPPFNTRFKINADFDFNQRLFKMKYKFIKAENFLSCALPHGISGTYHLMETFYIVKKNYGIFHAILAVMFSLFFIPRIIVYPLAKTQKTPDLRK